SRALEPPRFSAQVVYCKMLKNDDLSLTRTNIEPSRPRTSSFTPRVQGLFVRLGTPAFFRLYSSNRIGIFLAMLRPSAGCGSHIGALKMVRWLANHRCRSIGGSWVTCPCSS